ncbi:MAG TPA: uroporphyrinogen decarboxylase family protein [Spirochaetia bacterium]|nr:uroporphyrinogen decarboxylase family protein [Spirochaetia bacterium]
MTGRERVTVAIDHRQPDRTPYHVTFTEPARKAMADFYGDPGFEAGLGNCLEVLRMRLPYRQLPDRPAAWEDEWGVLWDRSIDTDIGTVCNTRVTRGNIRRYRFPDPTVPARFAHFPAGIAGSGGRFVIATLAFTLFERAWSLAGMEEVLMAMAEGSPFADELLDGILAFDVEVVRRALSFAVDGVRFGDDWGQQRGLIMGPELWRKYIKPRIAKLYGMVRSAGKKVFIHCCGKVDEIFPDLIDVGVDVFNPFQPEVMEVEAIKERYGEHISFFGGISTQRTLPYGTPSGVKDEVRRLIEKIGRDGGYIAAPAHDVPRDAKPENIAAMIEVLRSQA